MKNHSIADGAHLYFVTGADRIKMGRTNDVSSRVHVMQTGSPVPLTVVLVLPNMGPLEARLQRRLVRHRSHGEWYFYNTTLQRLVRHLSFWLSKEADPTLASSVTIPKRFKVGASPYIPKRQAFFFRRRI